MRLLLLALAGVTGFALFVTHRHYAARDAEAAVVSLMTHRFDGTTRSRLNEWLNRASVRSSTQTELPGPFATEVRVNLKIDEQDHWFRVGVRDRVPTPEGPAAAALVARLRADLLK